MKKLLLFVSCLFMLSLFWACSDDAEKSKLYHDWVLVSYGNETNEVLKEAEGYIYTITFKSDGSFTGQAYGNKYFGDYKCKGNKIEINLHLIEQAYYVGTDQDYFYINNIEKASSSAVTDKELRLYYSADQYFKFRKNE